MASLNAIVAADGTPTGKAIPFNGSRQLGWTTEYDNALTLTAGIIIIEWWRTPDFAGLWNEIARFDLATRTTDGTIGWGSWPGPIFGHARARVLSAIVGTSPVSVLLNALES